MQPILIPAVVLTPTDAIDLTQKKKKNQSIGTDVNSVGLKGGKIYVSNGHGIDSIHENGCMHY